MGRAHEVRAASMAKTAAKKSAANGWASKEIYMAAKTGGTDPTSNLALRTAIEKAKNNQIPRDVIDRAIKRAQGGDTETYIANRYEGMGPGNVGIVVDVLTSNVNRAAANIREVFNKNDGNPEGKVAFLFHDISYFAFEHKEPDQLFESLINDGIDVEDITSDEDIVEVLAPFKAFSSVKKGLDKMQINHFLAADTRTVPIDSYIKITDDEIKIKLQTLIDKLDELEDVQNVYHNAELM